MSRQSSTRLLTVLGVAVAAGVTILVVRQLPRIRRSMQRVRRAKPDGAVRSSAAPQVHRPSYAQVPRRAGELDAEDRGYLHHALAGGEGKSARRVSAARAEERTKRLTAPSPPSWPSRSAARSSR